MIQIDMKMPSSCLGCPFQLRSLISEQCMINNEVVDDCLIKRHKNCPLKEVK